MNNLIDLYDEYAAPMKGSERFRTWAALSCVSALLRRNVWLPNGGFGEIYPNTYICFVGGPGIGKSASSNMATRFLKRLNRKRATENKPLAVSFGPDKVTPAALFTRMSKIKDSWTSPTGEIETQASMYLHSSEMSTLIKDIGGGTLTDDLLKLFDNEELFHKELRGDGTIKIVNPSLSMLVDTTPTFLSSFVAGDESGTGFTARFIFVAEYDFVEIHPNPPAGDPLIANLIISQMDRISKLRGAMSMTEDAEKFWLEWFKDNVRITQNMPGSSFMRHFYARKAVHVKKIAILMSAAEGSSMMITEANLRDALGLIEVLEPDMNKSFGLKTFQKTDDLAKIILNGIPAGGARKMDLIRYLHDQGLSGRIFDLDGVIETLIQGGLVERTQGGHFRKIN